MADIGVATAPLAARKNMHNMPPSKVVHCRAVADVCKETDLVQAMKMFGDVKALKLMPKISQALVEYEKLESAIACVTYSTTQAIIVHGRQMYVNYSKSTEINRKFNSSQEHGPTKILLCTVLNVIHPVNVDTIKKICQQQNIEPQRIVIFHKNGLQAFVEFNSIDDATRILQSLNGCDIYPGCCTLKIEFSKSKPLNVHRNNEESYNIELGQLDMSSNGNAGRYGDWDAKPLTSGPESSYSGDPYSNYRNPMENNYMDPYSSQPYTEMANSNPTTGTDGRVAMVYGINNEVMNCNLLFNLFCLYGNVVKIKILTGKQGIAMVEYAERMSTEMAMKYFSYLTVFGQQLQISFSKHPFIAESIDTIPLFDGSQSIVSFKDSRNNRFNPVPGGRYDPYSRIHAPSKVLHYFNAPSDCTDERLNQLFESFKAEVPLKQTAISKPGAKTLSGLLEFSSTSAATEALMLVNHVTLHKEELSMDSMGRPGAPFTFKLAFSQSNTINK